MNGLPSQFQAQFAESALVAYNGNMRVLTAAEMRACDERTVERFGVPVRTLMENAGAAVARFALLRFLRAERLAVLCGKGNNGGDGLVAARHLAAAGKQVDVVLLAAPEQLRGDVRAAYEGLPRAVADGVLVAASEEDLSANEFEKRVGRADLLIDAVTGTGFHPPLRGLATALRDKIAKLNAPVLSVDLPSGWDADAMAADVDGAFRSDAVITFTAPKLAHVFGAMTRGPMAVAEIGSPEDAIQSSGRLSWTGSSKHIVERRRPVNSNKGKFGHVLVVGGSRGKAGAPSMAALAAMRAGAGLVTAAIPRGVAGVVAGFAPEMMTVPLRETENGGVARSNLDRRDDLLRGIDVLAVGPGIGREPETAEFVRALVGETKMPMVLDADGLNAFEGLAQELDGRGRTLVLTPHPGEMARLMGCTVAEVEKDRLGIARAFATEHHVTLVLKGWRTLVAHPDGQVGVNTSGNPAMAKGGSGDVLTGIVAAMLGQFAKDTHEAVETAVWLHGAAADRYVRTRDERTMLATDMLEHLSDAMLAPVDHDGFTWLQEGAR